jgi:prenyl protein peptidase
MAAPVTFNKLSLDGAILASLGMAGSFVLSLYLADGGKPRNHPSTIRRRILAVTAVTASSPAILWLLADTTPTLSSLLHTIGFKYRGLLSAILTPAALVLVLYAGPILQSLTSHDELFQFADERYDVMIRNYLVAPVAEEIVFRACMIPLLMPHLGVAKSVLIVPLFFGVAHVHHLVEHIRSGSVTVTTALLNALLQTTYTSIFGMFSAYLFVSSGHVASPIVAHVLCNMLGLPDVISLRYHKWKYLIGGVYVMGLIMFIKCLQFINTL